MKSIPHKCNGKSRREKWRRRRCLCGENASEVCASFATIHSLSLSIFSFFSSFLSLCMNHFPPNSILIHSLTSCYFTCKDSFAFLPFRHPHLCCCKLHLTTSNCQQVSGFPSLFLSLSFLSITLSLYFVSLPSESLASFTISSFHDYFPMTEGA